MSDHENASPSEKDGKFDKRAEALRRNLKRRKEEAQKKKRNSDTQTDSKSQSKNEKDK